MRANVLLVGVLSVLYAGFGLYAVSRDKPIDFYVYYMAAATFLSGGNPYDLDDGQWDELAAELGVPSYARHYRYPPLTAQLVTPLTLLAPKTAACIWLAANALMLILGALLLARSLETHRSGVLTLTCLLFFVPPLTSLYAGQVTGLLFACLAVALWSASRGREVALGTALGLGTCLKVTPVVLVGYLVWRRRWRALGASALAFGVLILVQLPFAGLEGMRAYLGHFLRLAQPGVLNPYPSNQTWNGFFARATTDNYWGPPLWEAPQLGLVLATAAAALTVLLTVVVCWPPGKNDERLGLELSLILVALQLAAPFSWYHQITLLIIPVCVLLVEVLRRGPQARWVIVLLVLGYLAVDLHGLFWLRLRGMTLALSLPLYATIALWIALAACIVRRKHKPPTMHAAG